MNPALRTDLLPASLPTFWLAAIVLLAFAAWGMLHVVFVRQKRPPLIRFALATPVGALVCWLTLQLAARWIFIATPWALWGVALVTITALEGTVLIYNHERMLIRPAQRRTLLTLRLAAIATVCLMLTQPVLHHKHEHRIPRRVAILVDDSDSMHRIDTFWTDAEQLDVAQALGTLDETLRPLRLAESTNQMFRTRLAYWTERLENYESDTVQPEHASLYTEASAAADWLEFLAEGLAQSTNSPPIPATHADDAQRIEALRTHLIETTTPALKALNLGKQQHAKDDAPPRDIRADLTVARQALDALHTTLPEAQEAADAIIMATLDTETKAAISNACTTTRLNLARRFLAQSPDGTRLPLFNRLAKNYDLELYTFNRGPVQIVDPTAWLEGITNAAQTNLSAAVLAERSETDITHAIEATLQQIPSEERAGLLLLTDGRHTGPSGVDALARQLGQAQTPVSTILVGGTEAPFDFAIAAVRANESIFLGDRVRVTTTISATKATGAETRLSLLRDGEVVDTRDIKAESIDWQEEFRLEDTPDAHGTYRYELVLENDPREAIAENNRWTMDIAVSDNRTHVLIVDRRPRWEFRYLRNLFYGRDKSVHLQYVLTEPDAIRGLDPETPLPPASASREFGDAEAGSLPETLEEWRKFDVIILGDLDEQTLTPDAVEAIHHCVETRGAMLVCIAGQRTMPMAITNTTFRALLPIVYTPTMHDLNAIPEPAFKIQLTPTGRTHPVMSLSASQAENEALWNAMPEWHWRLPISEIKPGAEILAIANTPTETGDDTFTLDTETAQSPQAALAAFAKRRQEETRQAVVVVQPYGLGKVLMLLSDRTWRLRYCTGDTHHHRLWGQIMRWGAGERLRSGNLYARMGTDRISYTPDEPIVIRARLADAAFTPLTDLQPQAIIRAANSNEITRINLEYQKGTSGLYEAQRVHELPTGSYEITLEVPRLSKLLGNDYPESLTCGFTMLASRQPKELAYVTADPWIPRLLATRSGGHALAPVESGILDNAFGAPSRTRIETREIPIWGSPWIFLILLSLLTAEWIIRKKGGLA